MKKNFKALTALFMALVLITVMIVPIGAANGGSSAPAANTPDSKVGSFISLLLLMGRMRYYDGNVLVGSQKLTAGEIIEPLELEDKDGLTLEGWYTDKKLTKKFDFSEPIRYGVKLYAKWVPIPEEVVDPEEVVEPEEIIEAEEAAE